jgi:hypothetical protein
LAVSGIPWQMYVSLCFVKAVKSALNEVSREQYSCSRTVILKIEFNYSIHKIKLWLFWNRIFDRCKHIWKSFALLWPSTLGLDFNIISVCKNTVTVMLKEDISGLVWHIRKSVWQFYAGLPCKMLPTSDLWFLWWNILWD